MATKEKRIFAELKKDVDAIVLRNATDPHIDQSFFYATGIINGLFEDCTAIIRPSGVEVVASDLEALSARNASVRTAAFSNRKQAIELLTKKLKGMKRIGINSRELTRSSYLAIKKCAKGARLVDVSRAIERARMIKDEDEISRLKRACEIASKGAAAIPGFTKKGMRETEAAAELDYRMMKMGASGASFPTNASWGPATAEPHYSPADRRLRTGQLALFDFGALYKRYGSDVTRTFVCGRPSPKQERMYEIVLEAQLAAIDSIKNGAHGKAIDHAAREIIDRSEFKGRFIHGTGHGIGLSVHDPGFLSSQRDMIVKESMVVTVEPGVYVKGFGGVRIEDDVLVTKSGCRVLTTASKEFISL